MATAEGESVTVRGMAQHVRPKIMQTVGRAARLTDFCLIYHHLLLTLFDPSAMLTTAEKKTVPHVERRSRLPESSTKVPRIGALR